MQYYNPKIEEIYYIQVTFKKIKTSKDAYYSTFKTMRIEEVKEKILSMSYKLVRRPGYGEREFALNDILIVTLDCNNIEGRKWLGYISIDGCFAAYNKNLEFCHKFIKDINDNIFEVRLFDLDDKEIIADINSLEDFKSEVKKHYAKKYKNFIDRFGEFDELVMADRDFYMLNNAKHSKKYNL